MAAKSTRAAQGSTFLRARDAFLNVFSDPVRGRRNWTLAAFGILVSNIILAGSYVRLASTAQWTPYIVRVDALGQVAYAGPAEKSDARDPQLVVYLLGLLVRNIRTVTTDGAVQVELIRGGYAYLTGAGAAFVNSHFSSPENDPRTLARTIRRTVKVNSVIPVPNSQSWRVRWTEEETPVQGGAPKATAWEGFFLLRFDPPGKPATEADFQRLQENPLGLHVTDVSWGPLAKGEVTQ